MTSAWRPAREVELIVGTPPGGGQDRPARAMMHVLQAEALVEAPMRLTNIPGRGGSNAWEALRERQGDAHVLSVSSAPLISNKVLGVSDFDHAALTPLATLYTEYLAFVVRVDSPLRTAAQLIERLSTDPAALTIAFATAVGTTNHIALGRIVQHLGHDPKRLKLHVFESALDAVADVVEGHAELGVISAVSAVKALEAGQLRTLAVSAPSRMSGIFSEAPTWAELSIPCTVGTWRGIIGPESIDEPAVAYWERAFGAAVRSDSWLAELARNHWTSTWKGSAETCAFLDTERAFLARMLGELGLTKA